MMITMKTLPEIHDAKDWCVFSNSVLAVLVFFAPIAKQMGDRIDRVGEFLYGNQSCEESPEES